LKNTTVGDFRICKFKPLNEYPDIEWLLVQWQEPELDSEQFALFKVNIRVGLCSTLIHSGVGSRQPDGKRWAGQSLAWWVLTMDDLKELFVAGQYVLGVMHWPDPEMSRRFFDPIETDCSVQEYPICVSEANL
jgi:hypothetical protein